MKSAAHHDTESRLRLFFARPANRITDVQINTAITDTNRFLASYNRGYRLRVAEMLNIGGLNQDHSNQTKTQPGYYAIQSTRMTEGQADRMTDAANGPRHHTVSGYTRYLATNGLDTIFPGLPNPGTLSGAPVRNVGTAVVRAAAATGDDEILLLRPGNYNEQLTIATPCTLRATRQGPVVIGKP